MKEVVQQIKLPEIFKAKIDDVKKNLNVVENKDFFAKAAQQEMAQPQEAAEQALAAQAQSNGGGL